MPTKYNRFNQFARFFNYIVILFIMMILLSSTSNAAVNTNVRVGLYYNYSVLSSANLANEVGTGYRFGYYDDTDSFTSVAYSEEEKITVCKDVNLYYLSDSKSYSPSTESTVFLGAYHLQTNDSFSTYEEALTASKSYPSGFPAYIHGEYVVRFEYYSSTENATADAINYSNVSVVGNSNSCYTVVVTGTNQILFEYDMGSTESYFGIMPDAYGKVKAQTWFKGYKYYGGFLYCRRNGGSLTVINVVPLEDYVAGVIPYEMSASWPLEALKAQATAARTFVCTSTKHASYGFDVCGTTCCQVYRGVYSGSHTDVVENAVTETAGKCIYYNNQLIQAFFFSADGGATEDCKNCWGTDLAYLKGIKDEYESLTNVSSYGWTFSLSGEELTDIIKSWYATYGENVSKIVKFEITKYTESGNVNEIQFTDSNGKKFTYSGDDTRGIFQSYFPSKYFSRHYIVVAPGETYTGTTSTIDAFYKTNGSSTTLLDQSFSVLTATGLTEVSGSFSYITAKGVLSSTAASAATGDFGTVTNSSKTDWLIVGNGYGHNLGMSQFGAKAMAELGFTYTDILKYYYTNVEIY